MIDHQFTENALAFRIFMHGQDFTGQTLFMPGSNDLETTSGGLPKGSDFLITRVLEE